MESLMVVDVRSREKWLKCTLSQAFHAVSGDFGGFEHVAGGVHLIDKPCRS